MERRATVVRRISGKYWTTRWKVIAGKSMRIGPARGNNRERGEDTTFHEKSAPPSLSYNLHLLSCQTAALYVSSLSTLHRCMFYKIVSVHTRKGMSNRLPRDTMI